MDSQGATIAQHIVHAPSLEPSLSFPFFGAGEKEPGIHCLRMRQFFPEIWELGYHSDISATRSS